VLLVPAALPIDSSPTDPTTELWTAGIAAATPTPATIKGRTSSP
jgi:hypothetical protein